MVNQQRAKQLWPPMSFPSIAFSVFEWKLTVPWSAEYIEKSFIFKNINTVNFFSNCMCDENEAYILRAFGQMFPT